MNPTLTIAKREFKERVKSRLFISMALLGPAIIIFGLYSLFSLSGSEKQNIKILVADPAGIMDNVMTGQQGQIQYTFAAKYIEIEDFANGPEYQKFDALLEINEKVLTNNLAFFFQRKVINPSLVTRIHRDMEKRLEMLKAAEFTNLNFETFRRVMHGVKLEVRDAYRPEMKNNYHMAAYTGFFFGLMILLFVFTFGMTILRSSSGEKSNRVAEVMLSIVKPRQLLLGKIVGIGASALLQTALWILGIALGLAILRYTLFPDMFSAQTLVANDGVFLYNSWQDLVFSKINFATMLPWFTLLFLLSYFFYGSIFAALGAAQGSESDGQKFLIPMFLLLLIAVAAGYFVIEYPQSPWSTFLSLFPFTAPMVNMINIALGIGDGGIWTFFLSLFIMLLSALILLRFAARVYKKALLNTGYRLNWGKLLKWGMRG
jgi:ABC-2 type transport system permease protein